MNNDQLPWTKKIDANGLRLTGPRRLIVEIISRSSRTLTAAEIFIAARANSKGIGLVTVYRTLEKLEEMNLVERVHQKDGCHAYIAHVDGHHHLLLCQVCHRVEYFSGDDFGGLI